jgi:N4-gp56 family major capsid protein
MADTAAATGLTVEQWDDQFFTEYFQGQPFRGLMGSGENSIFQVKEDLTKKKGDKLHYALVNRLTNSAVTGTNTLEGNEEDMASRSHQLTVNKRRNAVRIPEMAEQRSAIPLRNAAKSVLMDWAQEDTRDLIIQALESINGTAYASASEASKDAWLVDNADRVLFGAAKSNNASNDHSAALANIDNTNDKCTPSALSLLKRMALTASPKIRPIRLGPAGQRYFVAFAHPLCFRDLKDNSTIQQAQREVSLAKENNRLFDGGDLYWDGIIIKEIDDMTTLSGVGASSIDVGRVCLMGAQAVGIGYAKRWKSVTEEFDYGDKHGVAVESIYGVEKLTFGSGSGDTDDLKDHGVATGYFAAVADS